MTRLTVRNLSPGMKSFTTEDLKTVTLSPGDSRTIAMHPHHARLLLKDAQRKNPTIEITIDPDERKAMEEQLAELRVAPPKPVPFVTEKRFITDPATVPVDTTKKVSRTPPKRKKAERVALTR